MSNSGSRGRKFERIWPALLVKKLYEDGDRSKIRPDVVMLSGESAVGLYPVETVTVMSDIILKAEASNFRYRFIPHGLSDSPETGFAHALSRASHDACEVTGKRCLGPPPSTSPAPPRRRCNDEELGLYYSSASGPTKAWAPFSNPILGCRPRQEPERHPAGGCAPPGPSYGAGFVASSVSPIGDIGWVNTLRR